MSPETGYARHCTPATSAATNQGEVVISFAWNMLDLGTAASSMLFWFNSFLGYSALDLNNALKSYRTRGAKDQWEKPKVRNVMGAV